MNCYICEPGLSWSLPPSIGQWPAGDTAEGMGGYEPLAVQSWPSHEATATPATYARPQEQPLPVSQRISISFNTLHVGSQQCILISNWNLKREIVPNNVKLCKIVVKQFKIM